ncbi:MAG: SDR family NAD(P)-dependent oxidoreductase [Sulfitobacter sp.]
MKCALVTGGARGIGLGIARDLAADHLVAITYNTSDPAALLADHPNILPIKSDLADPAAAPAVIASVIAHFGRLDVLVNNAGAIETDDGDFSLNYAVNALAPSALFDAALPHLLPGACVVTISSVNAVLPAMGAAHYSASKAAVNTWTRLMAKTHGPAGIRLNAVAPGAIERPENPRDPALVQAFTDLTALGRVGRPQDIANAVRFLASDAASFITGEVLTVSGGYRL